MLFLIFIPAQIAHRFQSQRSQNQLENSQRKRLNNSTYSTTKRVNVVARNKPGTLDIELKSRSRLHFCHGDMLQKTSITF